MEGQVDACLGYLIRRCQNFVLRIKKKDESSDFVLWYLVFCFWPFVPHITVIRDNMKRKITSDAVQTPHCLHDSSPPIVCTSHMTWTFPTNTLCNLGNMAISQRVSIYRYKGELSKSKNTNWPQILNILNTHRMAKVEKYQADKV